MNSSLRRRSNRCWKQLYNELKAERYALTVSGVMTPADEWKYSRSIIFAYDQLVKQGGL